MRRRYNSLKIRALDAFENRGWLSPPAWAVLVDFRPVRASYTYLRRLYLWKLLDRAQDPDGLILYRLSARGTQRLFWLRRQAAAQRIMR